MKKGLISIITGIILGGLISYFMLDNSGWTYLYSDGNAGKTVNEIDIDLLFDSLLIIGGLSSFIYVVWSMVEKSIERRSIKS
ncbi:hypothetical protein [Pseudalkalibacillus berkeleyi]|uniref:Uncharacterized protein n=1 Tax=Pseudalkalibacillus berkeleyi TaxID=1069813 RepID=A0ABS9H0A0_9BACL|nr:hypothetical protein [Pseudalkalibacillus berkeleyi]MCF6137441.1 hypothetical protein [Pseudalkalibacillus berkeleyi]